MKKLLFILPIIFLVVIYFVIGIFLEKKINFLVSKLDTVPGINYQLKSYKRGFFNSLAFLDIQIRPENEFAVHQAMDFVDTYPQSIKLSIKFDIHHGPINLKTYQSDNFPLFTAGVVMITLDHPYKKKSDTLSFDFSALNGIAVEGAVDFGGDITIVSKILPSEKTIKLKENKALLKTDIGSLFIHSNQKINIINFNSLLSKISFELLGGITFRIKKAEIKGKLDLSIPQILDGKISFNIDQLNADNKKIKEQTFKLENIKLISDIRNQQKNNILVDLNLKVNKIHIPGIKLLDFMIEGTLEGASLEDISDIIKQFNDSNIPIDDFKLSDLINISTKWNIPKIKVDIDRLEFKNEIGKYHAKLKLETNNSVSGAQSSDLSEILKNFDGYLMTSLPASQIIDIITQQAEAQVSKKTSILGKTKSAKKIINQLVMKKIRDLENKRILIKENTNYRIQGDWNQGKLTVNGQDFSIKDLF